MTPLKMTMKQIRSAQD